MNSKSAHRRTVVLSEQHPFTPYITVGGHQYAKVFAQHGWNVAVVAASFNALQILQPLRKIPPAYYQLWKSRGEQVTANITNMCFAHLLPRCCRYSTSGHKWSAKLYLPRMQSVLKSLGVEKVDLLWLSGNEDWLYRHEIPHEKLAVRIVDNYAGFGAGYSNFHPLMAATLSAADGVFACSEAVKNLYSHWRREISIVPNGVEISHFTRRSGKEPEILRGIPRPRITYVGYIGSWFDLELLRAMAQARPNWHFVVAGPWDEALNTGGVFPGNIHIIGRIAYDVVPEILHHSDVGLVPFKNCDLVQGVSPIKVYEYLAAGLPVVSLRWPELEREHLPILLAETPEQFLKATSSALNLPLAIRDGLHNSVQACSWEQRLQTILKQLGLPLSGDRKVGAK